MEFCNNFGEWKNIINDNFEINNVVFGLILVCYKYSVNMYELDI